MGGFAEAFAAGFYSLVLALVSVGVFVGWVLFVGLPWLWVALKPLLHAVTV